MHSPQGLEGTNHLKPTTHSSHLNPRARHAIKNKAKCT